MDDWIFGVKCQEGRRRRRKKPIIGEIIRLIKLEKRRAASKNGPYWSKAVAQEEDCSGGRRFRRILEPSRGGRGRRLKMARDKLTTTRI